MSSETQIALRILRHASDYLYAEFGIENTHGDLLIFKGIAAKNLHDAVHTLHQAMCLIGIEVSCKTEQAMRQLCKPYRVQG